MQYKKNPTLKFSNKLQEEAYGTWLFEEEYEALLAKTAPQEKFMRIIGASDGRQFYYFQLRTPTRSGSFYLANPMGVIDALWAFLEALCLGKKFASFLTEYEGPNALLCAKEIDKDNLRVTLICDTWLELAPDKCKFIEKCWPDFKPHASIDAVVNKKHFIYTLYLALEDIFVNDNGGYSVRRLCVGSAEYAQADSWLVKKYLGYLPFTDKDRGLQKALLKGTAIEVEKWLKEGANPNALSFEEGEFGLTLLEHFWIAGYEREDDLNKKEYLKKNELLLKYGAMPRSLFSLFYSGYLGDKKIRLEIFRMFFAKHCFIRYDFWDCVVFDIHNESSAHWAIYETIVREGLWAPPPLYACTQNISYCREWYQNF